MEIGKRLGWLMLLGALGAIPSDASKVGEADYNLNLVPYDINIRDYQFPSGLRVVFQEDHTRPVVSVNLVVDAGSGEDPEGMDGLAHLVEHLCFRARHGDLPKNMDFIKQIGGAFNANTSEDRTMYMTVAPRDALVPLLRLESLRLGGALNGVTEEVMNVEREVVRNELRGNLEQGVSSFIGYISAQLFPEGHHSSRTTIGTHETINNITFEETIDWANKWYRPEHSTIVVVGDFSLDETAGFIQEAFTAEQLTDPDDPEAELSLVELEPRVNGPSEEPPPPVTQELTYAKANVDKPLIIMAWSLPGAFRGQDAQWSLTTRMMDYAIGKYLYPEWDYEHEANNAFGCFYWAGKYASKAMCSIEISEDEDPQRVVDKALDGLYELWNTDNRFQQQRGQYVEGSIPLDILFKYAKLSWMAAQFQTVEDVASVMGRGYQSAEYLHQTGDPMYFSSSFQELASVNPYDAADMAYKYLNRDRYTAVVLEPLEAEEKAKAERKGLEGNYDGVQRDDMGELLFDAGELTDEFIRENIVPPNLDDLRRFTLDNGLHVVVVPHGIAPIARVRLQFLGGELSMEPRGLGDFASYFADWEYDDNQGPLEFAGSRSISIGNTTTSIDVVGSAGNIRAQLNEARFGVDTLHVSGVQARRYVKSIRRARDRDEQDPHTWASRYLWSNTFPDHPLSSIITDEELEVRSEFTRKDGERWVAEIFKPTNAILYVVGNIDAEAAEADVKEIFGDWSPRKGATTGAIPGLPPSDPAKERQILVFDKPGATQADLAFMCRFPEATYENRAPRQVLSQVYSDILWKELRETAGTTYGAYAYQGEYRGGLGLEGEDGAHEMAIPAMQAEGDHGGLAYLAASTQIQSRSVDLAINTLLGGLETIQEGGIPDAKVQTIKWNLGRSATTTYQTTSQVIGGLSTYSSTGYSYMKAADYADQLSAVAASSFPGLLKECVGHEVITIVGPEEAMVQEVEEAGYTPEVIDWRSLIQDEDLRTSVLEEFAAESDDSEE